MHKGIFPNVTEPYWGTLTKLPKQKMYLIKSNSLNKKLKQLCLFVTSFSKNSFSASKQKKKMIIEFGMLNLIKIPNFKFKNKTTLKFLFKFAQKGYFRPNTHCVKSVRIQSYSALHFPHSDWIRRHTPYLSILPECGKMLTRITPNTDTLYAVVEKVNITIAITSSIT